jgi:hypothetical protein
MRRRVRDSVGMQYYTDETLFSAFCTNFPQFFFFFGGGTQDTEERELGK